MSTAAHKWTVNWTPRMPDQTERLVFLEEVRAAVEQSHSWGGGVPVEISVVLKLLRSRILTPGQIGNLLSITRAYVYKIKRTFNIPDGCAPRGLIDTYGLDLMYLTVQQLQLGRTPNEVLLEHLPFCGDISIVSYLTGVPKSVINRYRKEKEDTDGIEHRQRMANAAEFRGRPVSALR
jgi:hypothetical protein